MKKIVQLDEYEYNKLAELAKLNEEQINQKAADLWEKKGVAEIEINIETGHDTEGTEKVSLQLFKELNLHIACILFGYVQIFCTLMP